ncbi:hypothetical protein KEM54_005633 [Ascosphaera aggregata]|nr:hypothetical protein KEM54_005633 [Ascosphaera aggregata]
MGMKLGKKSKRTPTRLRAKIEKAGAAKQRKERKLAKKVGETQYWTLIVVNPEWRSRIKKDPGIPNSFPFKDKILAEIEERKRLQEEEKIRLRDEARQARKEEGRQLRKDAAILDEQGNHIPLPSDNDHDLDDMMEEDMEDFGGDDSNPMAALLASARARAAEYTGENEIDAMDEDDLSDGEEIALLDDDNNEFAVAGKDSSRKQFDKVFKTVTQAADVILYVLDARDPEGTRSKTIEREILSADGGNKRLILILNKIDLIPPSVLKNWLLYLRRYFPTLPLRASHSASNANTFDHKALTVKSTSETLFKALKHYAQSKQLKRAISVGVIGYPNVGKSSVINALTSRLHRGKTAACPTGAEAGVTTSLREVKIDSKLKLIDSPGIVFPSSDKKHSKSSSKDRIDDEARLVLLNAIPPKQITDPIPAVSLLLQRFSTTPDLMQKLLDIYGIPPLMSTSLHGDKTHDFLIQVARKRGRLGKGGVPNFNSAAMTVITDWRDGRIQGWVEPPTTVAGPAGAGAGTGKGLPAQTIEGGDKKEIVTQWAEEFKIEGLWGDVENDGEHDEMAVE